MGKNDIPDRSSRSHSRSSSKNQRPKEKTNEPKECRRDVSTNCPKRSRDHKRLPRSSSREKRQTQTLTNSSSVKKLPKRKRSSSRSSNSSTDSDSDSSDSSTSSTERKNRRKEKKRRKKEKKLKRKKKKEKKKIRKLSKLKKLIPVSVPLIASILPVPVVMVPISKKREEPDRLLADRAKVMAPMTKEEWDKRQSVIKRVYDEETGRHRLIKGDGEVIEEIVSRDRHMAINRQATKGDGDYFQATSKKRAK